MDVSCVRAREHGERERVCGVSDGAQPGEEDEGGEQGEDGE